jgi:hypothetical protein
MQLKARLRFSIFALYILLLDVIASSSEPSAGHRAQDSSAIARGRSAADDLLAAAKAMDKTKVLPALDSNERGPSEQTVKSKDSKIVKFGHTYMYLKNGVLIMSEVPPIPKNPVLTHEKKMERMPLADRHAFHPTPLSSSLTPAHRPTPVRCCAAEKPPRD